MRVVLFTSEPEVPVMVSVAFPTVAVDEAVSVRVEAAVLFAAGVTELGENTAVTPAGKPVAVSEVAALKLFLLVTVMVLAPLLPCTMLREVGESAIVKFAEAAALTVSVRVAVSAVPVDGVPVTVTV